jgi:DNA-binding NarL/FixJ family response regulator
MFNVKNLALTPVTVLLIDHSPMMRVSVKQVLERIPITKLVIEAEAIDQVEHRLKKFGTPELITYHLHFINDTVVYQLRELKSAYPLTPLIVFSGLSLSLTKTFCLTVGAECYIQDSSTLDNVLSVFTQFLNLSDRVAQSWKPLRNPLTKRQIQILSLMDSGHGNLEIADQLNLAIGTVKTHLTRINKILGSKSRMQAVFLAKQKKFFETSICI